MAKCANASPVAHPPPADGAGGISVRRVCVLIGCVAVGGSGAARSEDIVAARECAGIAESDARLACYDRAFRGPPEALFGDTGQLRPDLAGQKNLPKSVTATVLSVTPLAQGLYRLSLDNGQIWQTRAADWAIGFQSSDAVTISRMPLGGYQISMAGSSRSIDAKRIK